MTLRSSLLLFLSLAIVGPAGILEVANDAELRQALTKAKAGDTIRLAPGAYRPGIHVRELHGTREQPIVIEGTPGAPAPRFENGNTGLQFVQCRHLVLRHLAIAKQRTNGLNLDDGGEVGTAHHIRLENLQLSAIGSGGNHDAIKLSGVDDFVVRGCTVTGWDGQAIDMVGCHRGLIEKCSFRGVAGRRQSAGPQTKGGSSDITIRRCRFENAGGRPLNLGGSTGMQHFRPRGAKFEARNITAHDNLIRGGMCAVAFTGLDGGEFHHNTIVQPDKWVFRVLQETAAPGFAPCRKVKFYHNLIVFERRAVRGVANVGGHTDAASFAFSHNAWFASDAPARSEPQLPAPARDSVAGRDPQLDPATGRPAADWAKGFGVRPE